MCKSEVTWRYNLKKHLKYFWNKQFLPLGNSAGSLTVSQASSPDIPFLWQNGFKSLQSGSKLLWKAFPKDWRQQHVNAHDIGMRGSTIQHGYAVEASTSSYKSEINHSVCVVSVLLHIWHSPVVLSHMLHADPLHTFVHVEVRSCFVLLS